MADALSITVGSGIPEDQLAPGNYPATLKSVTARTITVNSEDREVFEWLFLVDTENEDGSPGEPIEVGGLSSQMTGPQSKTAMFLSALMGAEAVQPGRTFTMNDLVGKRCLIQTVFNKGGYAKVESASAIPATPVKTKPSNRAVAAATTAAAVAAPEPAPSADAEGAVTAAGDDDLPF